MNNEIVHLNRGEVQRITLPGRGSTGLQLLHRTDNDSILLISRVSRNKKSDETGSNQLGGSVEITFEMKGLEPGETKVTFYETLPWEKDFKEIVVKELTVQVK